MTERPAGEADNTGEALPRDPRPAADQGVPDGQVPSAFGSRFGEQLSAALKPLADDLRRTGAAFSEAIRPALLEFARNMEAATAGLEPLRETVRTSLAPLAEIVTEIQRRGAEAHVENWSGLTTSEMARARDLIIEGLPLAWVPPAEIVKALVSAADHTEQDEVLAAHGAEISAGARTVLGFVTHPDLIEVRDAAIEAWDAFDHGHQRSAQALASTCIGEVVDLDGLETPRPDQSILGVFRNTVTERWRETPPEEWGTLEGIRRTSVRCSLAAALQKESEAVGFNRMITAHRVTGEQFTSANALRGLMLMTSSLRELQFSRAEEWRTTQWAGEGRALIPGGPMANWRDWPE